MSDENQRDEQAGPSQLKADDELQSASLHQESLNSAGTSCREQDKVDVESINIADEAPAAKKVKPTPTIYDTLEERMARFRLRTGSMMPDGMEMTIMARRQGPGQEFSSSFLQDYEVDLIFNWMRYRLPIVYAADMPEVPDDEPYDFLADLLSACNKDHLRTLEEQEEIDNSYLPYS